MKLLINGFHELPQFSMVEELMSQLNVNELHWITTQECKNHVIKKFPGATILLWENFFWGISDRSLLKGTRPLGEDDLSFYSECESVALKMMDRFCFRRDYSYQARRQAFLDYVRYWEGYLDNHSIDLFVSQNVPHEVFDYVLLEACKRRGIKTLMFYQSQLSDCIVPMVCYDEGVIGFEKAMAEDTYDTASEEDKKFIEHDIDAICKNKPPFYMERSSLLKKSLREIRRIVVKSRTFDGYLSKKITFPYLGYKISLEKRKAEIRFTTRRLNSAYKKFAVPIGDIEPFVYLALHYQPELTTCPLAGPFVDQGLIIELLSEAAPENVKIYVKEHPKQTSVGREIAFYERYSKLPNVRFIPLDYPSHTLIDDSLCVATCTGTAGWEALIRGKNVLVFGDIFYKDAPGAHRIRKIDDLMSAFTSMESGNKPEKHEKAMRNYMAALRKVSIAGIIDPAYAGVSTIGIEKSNQNIARYIIHYISENGIS